MTNDSKHSDPQGTPTESFAEFREKLRRRKPPQGKKERDWVVRRPQLHLSHRNQSARRAETQTEFLHERTLTNHPT